MPLWFIAVFVPMVASQIVRLYQHDAGAWLACDYAGRLGALALLALIPGARAIAFQRGTRQVGWLEVALWTGGLVFFYFYFAVPVRHVIDQAIPGTRLGGIPHPAGLLRLFDSTAGLALVALHEEIVFRRCARFAFGKILGDGWAMVAASAILFGAYHWWSGLGNAVHAALFGAYAMLFLRRTGILWPIVLAHFAVDEIVFYT